MLQEEVVINPSVTLLTITKKGQLNMVELHGVALKRNKEFIERAFVEVMLNAVPF